MNDTYKLDDEEQALLESVERDEWESVPNLEEKIAQHRQIARNTLRKVRLGFKSQAIS